MGIGDAQIVPYGPDCKSARTGAPRTSEPALAWLAFPIIQNQNSSEVARVTLVSLGCPKNLVDSECALGEIVRAGHQSVVDESPADVIVVNTCAFIESARAESLEAILDALGRKRARNCRTVAVVGCLSQRFAADLAAEMPEVDVVLGINHAGKLAGAIERALAGERIVDVPPPGCEWKGDWPRVQWTPPWTAYLKVSDGCDNRCAYCAIPDIRAVFGAGRRGSIVDKARRLVDGGVRELVLVGQDLARYGADLGQSSGLVRLLEKLGKTNSLRWVRSMYCYPTKITPELIDMVGHCDKIAKYMDMPLQHGDDRMLSAMGRRGGVDSYLRLVMLCARKSRKSRCAALLSSAFRARPTRLLRGCAPLSRG